MKQKKKRAKKLQYFHLETFGRRSANHFQYNYLEGLVGTSFPNTHIS